MKSSFRSDISIHCTSAAISSPKERRNDVKRKSKMTDAEHQIPFRETSALAPKLKTATTNIHNTKQHIQQHTAATIQVAVILFSTYLHRTNDFVKY